MVKEMSSYFGAERPESLLLIAARLLQIVVGASVCPRTDAQLNALRVQLQTQPMVLKVEETDRMQTGMKNLSIDKTVEMLLLLLVVGVGVIAFLPRSDFAAGIGIGLVLQAAFTLSLDVFAEATGADNLSVLQLIHV